MTERDRRKKEDELSAGDDIFEPLLIITPEVVDDEVDEPDEDLDEGEGEEMMEEWL